MNKRGMKMLEDKDELPPVYVITLAEEPWKGLACKEHLRERGIKATFLVGFQGAMLGLRASNPIRLLEDGTPHYTHPSQLGLVLSYLHALRVGVLTSKSEFIICEDDVNFPENFTETYWDYRTWQPKSIDVVQLSYGGDKDKPSVRVNEGFRYCYYPFWATCIWWTVKAAAQAIQMLRPICEPLDIALINRVYPFLNHGVPTVSLVGQRSAKDTWPSSIGSADKEMK